MPLSCSQMGSGDKEPQGSEAGAGAGRTQGLQGWGERWLGEGSRSASEEGLNCRESEQRGSGGAFQAGTACPDTQSDT